MSGFFRQLGKWLLRIAATGVILLALLVGVARLLLPEVPRFADEVRQAVQQATGFEIDFQLLSAGVSLYGPELRLTDVTVRWPEGEQVFAAGGISVAIDLLQLVTRQQIAPGLVHIEDLAVDLQIEADGTVLLQGRPVDDFVGRTATEQPLQALRISLDDVDVRFADRKRGIEPVDARVEYLIADVDNTQVAVEADIRPTAEFASRIEIDGVMPLDLLSDRTRLNSADLWNLNISAVDFRLDSWLQLVELQDMPLIDSNGAARAELEFAGLQPVAIRVDADIDELLLAQPDGEAVSYDAVSGELSWQKEATGWLATGRDLRFLRDGQRRPAGNFRIRNSGNETGSVDWSASAESLSLTDLMPFAAALAAPQLEKAGVGGTASGDIWRLQVEAELVAGEIRDFSVESDFENVGYTDTGLGISSRGLSGALRADESGGSLRLATRDALLGWDKWFRESLPVTSLEGLAVWRVVDDRLRLIVSDLFVETPDGGGTASLELTTDMAFSEPWVDLTAEASMQDATQVIKYLPRKVPDKTVAWLDRALEQGTSPRTEFRLRGPLRKFPFRSDGGEFLIDIEFADARLRFADDWPAVENASGRLVLENESIYSTSNRASIGGMDFVDTQLRIADLKKAELEIAADGRVPLPELLRFLRDTPVAARLGEVFNDVRAGGQGRLQGRFRLPIRALDRWQLQATLDVTDASAWLRTLDQRFSEIKGRVSIANTFVSGQSLTATLLDEPVSINITPDKTDGAEFTHRATVAGRFPFAKIEAELGVPKLGKIGGGADLQAEALFPAPDSAEPFQILVTSRLQGISSSLPDPLRKDAATEEDFSARVKFPADGAIDIGLTLERGVLADITYRRVDDEWALRGGRARIGMDDDVPASAEGIALTLVTDRVRVDEWVDAFRDTEAPARGRSGPARSWQSYFSTAVVRADELEVLGYQFSDTDVRVNFGRTSWDLDISGPWIEGRLNVPFRLDSDAMITGDLARLFLIEPVAAGESSADEYSSSPLDMPGYSGTINDFALGNMRLGRMIADVRPVADGLEVRSVTLTAPSLTGVVSGDWTLVANAQRSRMRVELKSNDVEKTLKRLALAPVISAEQGTLVADLIWEGGPGDDIISAATGTVTMLVRDGAIDDIDAGGGRLLGLLSVAALPRRLALDFTDLTEDKLTFSKISADFRIDFGNAHTCNLGLEGEVADMALVGRTGLKAQDYNQVAVVRPHLSNMLPVPAAFLGGPTAGVAALLLSQIFKKPISGIGETYYTVTGDWENSNIKRVQRSELDTTPFADCQAQLPNLSPEEVAAIEELVNQAAQPATPDPNGTGTATPGTAVNEPGITDNETAASETP